jgi:hypothetical protein
MRPPAALEANAASISLTKKYQDEILLHNTLLKKLFISDHSFEQALLLSNSAAESN